MKAFLIILLIVVVGLLIFMVTFDWGHPRPSLEDHLDDEIYGQLDENALFEKFIFKFDRRYKSEDERKFRLDVFTENLKELLELAKNAQGSVKFGMTQFMDWTNEEKASILIPKGQENHLLLNHTNNDIKPKMPNVANRGGDFNGQRPDNFDWRSYGVVSSVKNQGGCGSCWAFAAIAAIESQKALWYKYLPDLSEQDLVDCDTYDKGCGGGWPSNAMKWTMEHGVADEASYPYVGHQQACRAPSSGLTKINNWYNTGPTEDSAADWLYKYGPMTHAILVPDSFFHYKSGVYHPSVSECSSPKGGHAMAVVGYGVDNGIPYWFLKNSWGSSWGEGGFLKFYRGDWSCSMGYQMAMPYQ